MEETKTLKILVKEPYKEPYVKEIEDKLENLQEIVGGYIECVGMPNMKNVDLYVNEEGKLDKADGNFWLPEYEDCVCGTCFMVGANTRTGENVSLTDKQIEDCKKYIKNYEIPVGFDLYEDFEILDLVMRKKYSDNKKQLDVAEM